MNRMDEYNRARMPHLKQPDGYMKILERRKRTIKTEMKEASEKALRAARTGPIHGGIMASELNYLLGERVTQEQIEYQAARKHQHYHSHIARIEEK
jgi:hypothetical protein